MEENPIYEGAKAIFSAVLIKAIDNKGKRVLDVAFIQAYDPDTQQTVKLRFTLVAEPAVFNGTIYPEDSPIETSVISQLKAFEKLEST